MQKNKSSQSISEFQQNEKDNLQSPRTGITRRLLEKYKSKKDFTVIDGRRKSPEVNIAA